MGKALNKEPFLASQNNYYVATTQLKIKCRECGSAFVEDMFRAAGTGAVCKCENVTIKALPAPETKFGYWLTVEYKKSFPLLVEKVKPS